MQSTVLIVFLVVEVCMLFVCFRKAQSQ